MSSYDSKDDGLDEYFTQIKTLSLLNAEEEIALSKRVLSGDKEALAKLVESNLRLVIKIARQFCIPGVSLLDLIQEGNLGLMHAAEKFDFKREVRFSTYASWWIKQSISRALANKRRVIRIPHRKEEAIRKIKVAGNLLNQELRRNPTIEELAKETCLDEHEVVELIGYGTQTASLDCEMGEDQSNLHDVVQDLTYAPEEIMERSFVVDEVNELLDQLERRERIVLIYRYALSGQEKLTLKSLSQKLGVSPETIRQIEMRALRKMRGYKAKVEQAS